MKKLHVTCFSVQPIFTKFPLLKISHIFVLYHTLCKCKYTCCVNMLIASRLHRCHTTSSGTQQMAATNYNFQHTQTLPHSLSPSFYHTHLNHTINTHTTTQFIVRYTLCVFVTSHCKAFGYWYSGFWSCIGIFCFLIFALPCSCC